MSLKLSAPLVKEFPLTEADAAAGDSGEPTMVTIRQAENGEVEKRNELFSSFQREYVADAVRVTQDISFDAVRRKEVFLTLAACNIQNEDGKQLFMFKDGHLDNELVFQRAWSKLPPAYALAIHQKVLEMNPMWKPEVGEGN